MTGRASNPTTRYRVDADDRIRFVGDGWAEFARENTTGELEPERVVGRPIWDFITHPATRQLYQMIFAAVRSQSREFRIPFRCDAPALRRYMELRIAPTSEGMLEHAAVLLREEPRDPAALLDPSVPRTDEWLSICSWCKNVRLASGEWVDVETAIRTLELFDGDSLPSLSHGICEPCESRIEDEFERSFDQPS